MTLVLQTNISGRISVWVVEHRRILRRGSLAVLWHGSDRALALVERILRSAKRTPKRITNIIVVRGPGPFTAVRTGLIIANTLSMILGVPVRGVVRSAVLTDQAVLSLCAVRTGTNRSIRPWYGKAPNITRPRRRAAKG